MHGVPCSTIDFIGCIVFICFKVIIVKGKVKMYSLCFVYLANKMISRVNLNF